MEQHQTGDRGGMANMALHPETLMMSYGYRPEWSEGAIKPPVFATSTFVFKTAEDGKNFFKQLSASREPGTGESSGLIYGRMNHPGLEILEDRLCLWDGAEAALAFESGMAAISTTLLALLDPGDVILFSEPLYGGTDGLFHKVLARFGIRSIGVPPGGGADDIATVLDAESARKLRMIYLETPANPTNTLVDIAFYADLARRYSTGDRRVVVAVDNTFLGPIWQHPLKHGADLVLYSATKYIGGHSDVIAGAVLGSAELIREVRTLRTALGTMAGPWTSWLLLRSLETLQLRMVRQTETAGVVARFLDGRSGVGQVHYLGLLTPDDPQYDIYQRQCLSPGAMMSFNVGEDEAGAFRFLNALKLIKLAVSLGGTESLISHPGSTTHAGVPEAERLRTGITETLVRLSIGVEHPDDLIADLTQALAAV